MTVKQTIDSIEKSAKTFDGDHRLFWAGQMARYLSLYAESSVLSAPKFLEVARYCQIRYDGIIFAEVMSSDKQYGGIENSFKDISEMFKKMFYKRMKMMGYSIESAFGFINGCNPGVLCLDAILTGKKRTHFKSTKTVNGMCSKCFSASYETFFDHAKLIKRKKETVGLLCSPYNINIEELYNVEKFVKKHNIKLKVTPMDKYMPGRTYGIWLLKENHSGLFRYMNWHREFTDEYAEHADKAQSIGVKH